MVGTGGSPLRSSRTARDDGSPSAVRTVTPRPASMWHETEASRRLGIRYPIIQGPFDGGASSANPTATVSNAGGLGSFGVHTFTPQQIAETAGAIRNLTDNPFALNLWVPNGICRYRVKHSSNGVSRCLIRITANSASRGQCGL